MKKRWRSIFILALILISALWLFRLEENKFKTNLKLGLDLVGGAQLIFEANPDEAVPKIDTKVMDSLKKVFQNRVNLSGTSEALVSQIGKNRLMVEVPGKSPRDLRRRLLKTAKLEFKELDLAKVKKLQSKSENPTKLRNLSNLKLWKQTGITGADLKESQYVQNQSENWRILFEIKKSSAQKFGKLTQRLAKNKLPLGIFLDEKLISYPKVNSMITQYGEITGSFTLEEARDLSIQLNAGALPVSVKLISERVVGPSLGRESIVKSLRATTLGLLLIAIFMISVYRLPGLISTFSLCLYVLFSLALFTQGVVLSLSGIAGFVLSIGMAVDANILIFERIKEELAEKKGLLRSVELGFQKAFPSIRDSNLNTLIVCLILIIFGTDLVRGFGITLAIGVIVSFLSAIIITQEFLELILKIPALRKSIFFGVNLKSN